MTPFKNTQPYVCAHAERLQQVEDFKKLSDELHSSFGKFFSYLLFSNLNMSVNLAFQEAAGDMILDENRNVRAREKEMIDGKFVLREEFVAPLQQMKDTAAVLSKEKLHWMERIFLEMFVRLIEQFEKGELFPDQVIEDFEMANGTLV